MIAAGKGGKWNITNLGAVLFAKKLADFCNLKQKSVRVVLYKNESRVETIREEVPMFPDLAIRELVANAIIHQDLHAASTAPMVEIFSSRMEIINSDLPLVKTDRFLDSPPKSRNETPASFMRRIGICEERSAGYTH